MTHLVVLAYADEYRAAEVVATLQRLRTGSIVSAADVVSVVRRTDWSVSIRRGEELAASDDRSGAFWRELVATLILTPGDMSLRRQVADFGIEATFERRLSAALPPGSSAAFMLVPHAHLAQVTDELETFGGTLFSTPIERAFGGTEAAA